MTFTDAGLYARGIATLLACWEENARGAPGAMVARSPGVAAAVFPAEPEAQMYNNAVLDRDLSAVERAAAVEAMEAVYASAGIAHFAAWVHERDAAMCSELIARGYSLNEWTRAMGMSLEQLTVSRPEVELGPPDWFEYLRLLGVPGLLIGADPEAFYVLVARRAGVSVATAMAFDCAGDCGIFNVTTLESARRQGYGSALAALHLHDALARGCETASLQSTEIAERMYAMAGFRDLGRILEYVPAGSADHASSASAAARGSASSTVSRDHASTAARP
jgi:ribosomal protein S18 acetylase RimI-like enzyme